MNEYVPSHLLKSSSSRALAFARARLLASSDMMDRGWTRFLWYNSKLVEDRKSPGNRERQCSLFQTGTATLGSPRGPGRLGPERSKHFKSSYLPWDSSHLKKSSRFTNN